MDPLLAAALAAGAAGVALWTYFRREPDVRGRAVLALLRVGALLLLVLLLWNPTVPAGMDGDAVRAPEVLLDASLSMTATDSAGSSAWRRALERAREVAGPEGRVLMFGSSARAMPLDSAAEAGADDTGTRLAPALERVAALGGSSVRVLSDFRLEDPVEVRAALEETGLGVTFEDVGGPVRNAGLEEIDVPGSLDAGGRSSASILLAGEGGGPGDSVTLEIRVGDRLLGSRRVPLPGQRRPVRHRLDFAAPGERGVHRLDVRAVLPDDGFGADDRRTAVLEVEPDRGGLLLLSLEPDWEPRYLLPVLEQVTGMDARGFLRLTEGRWLPMGRSEERGGSVETGRIRERAAESGFLVLHGLGGEAPAWIRERASGAERLLVFPDGPAGAETVDVGAGPWEEAEWYASPELPSSPLAGELAGVSLEGLPPLNALLPLTGASPAGRVPLQVRRGRSGPLRPAVLLSAPPERRAAVVLASGFWRWGARDGAPREAYRRVWSAAAGWLLERPATEGVAGVVPARRPASRAGPLEWRVRGPVGDTLHVRLEAGDSAVLDTTVVRSGALARTPAPPPGRYAYRIEAQGLEAPETGELEVSGFSDELLRPRIEPPGSEATAGGAGAGGGGGRPLRTHPAPYLVLLVLLSAEWIGRRRQGLR